MTRRGKYAVMASVRAIFAVVERPVPVGAGEVHVVSAARLHGWQRRCQITMIGCPAVIGVGVIVITACQAAGCVAKDDSQAGDTIACEHAAQGALVCRPNLERLP